MAGKKVLLVEGTDDEHVLKHLCGNRGIGPLDEIREHGGADRLLEAFPVRLMASEDGDIVGMVVDADGDVASRWESLRWHLVRLGYPAVPGAPAPDGTILDPPLDTLLPRVGIWIMPNNQTSGILEDFLAFLVPDGSVLFAHVQASVAAIPQAERRFGGTTEGKAIIHTWLAWQKEPGKPLGQAITARYLDPGSPNADALVVWLNRLFSR